MKIRLFLTSSLSLLGLWLAVAYMHQTDIESYSQSGFELEASTAEVEAPLSNDDPKVEYEAITSAR